MMTRSHSYATSFDYMNRYVDQIVLAICAYLYFQFPVALS